LALLGQVLCSKGALLVVLANKALTEILIVFAVSFRVSGGEEEGGKGDGRTARFRATWCHNVLGVVARSIFDGDFDQRGRRSVRREKKREESHC
jgi:hypothetical protein